MAHSRSPATNVALYPWFMAAANAYFWMPVFFLYFSESLSLGEVLLLEAIYYASVFLLEVPSGWFSDAIGRRPTLVVAAIAHMVAYALFSIGGGLTVFALAQVCLATGMAFISGTETAMHYDSLHAAGRGEELAVREARVAQIASVAMAVSALVGGLVGAIDLRLAYALSFFSAAAMLVMALRFVEPGSTAPRRRGLAGQLGACGRTMRRADLRWLFAFAVFAYALNHVPYHLAQPYVDVLIGRREGTRMSDATPIVTGALTTAVMLVRSLAAGRSIVLRDAIGLRAALLVSMALQVGVIAVCSAWLHPLVLVALLVRSAPTGLQRAPLAAAITPEVDVSIRATYLSLQTLAGRLTYTGFLVGLAALIGTSDPVTWPGISRMATAAAGVGAVILVGLLVTSGAVGRGGRDGTGGPPES